MLLNVCMYNIHIPWWHKGPNTRLAHVNSSMGHNFWWLQNSSCEFITSWFIDPDQKHSGVKKHKTQPSELWIKMFSIVVAYRDSIKSHSMQKHTPKCAYFLHNKHLTSISCFCWCVMTWHQVTISSEPFNKPTHLYMICIIISLCECHKFANQMEQFLASIAKSPSALCFLCCFLSCLMSSHLSLSLFVCQRCPCLLLKPWGQMMQL